MRNRAGQEHGFPGRVQQLGSSWLANEKSGGVCLRVILCISSPWEKQPRTRATASLITGLPAPAHIQPYEDQKVKKKYLFQANRIEITFRPVGREGAPEDYRIYQRCGSVIISFGFGFFYPEPWIIHRDPGGNFVVDNM
jgi:hypothetical protein